MRKIYFDTETTGLNCKDCQIIELAMLIYEDDEKILEYDEFINVGYKLPPKIIELTGITDEMVQNGADEKDVASFLKENLTSDTLMIAHNCQFDLSFVYQLLYRHYPDEALDIVSDMDWLDTLTVLKDRKKYPHKLIDGVNHYDISEVNFHRAIDDTKALYDLTSAMKNERDDLREYINIFGYNPKYGVSGGIFPFITYKKQDFNNRMVSSNSILPNK